MFEKLFQKSEVLVFALTHKPHEEWKQKYLGKFAGQGGGGGKNVNI